MNNKEFYINITDKNVITGSSQINCNKNHLNVLNEMFDLNLKNTNDLKKFLKSQKGEEFHINDM